MQEVTIGIEGAAGTVWISPATPLQKHAADLVFMSMHTTVINRSFVADTSGYECASVQKRFIHTAII